MQLHLVPHSFGSALCLETNLPMLLYSVLAHKWYNNSCKVKLHKRQVCKWLVNNVFLITYQQKLVNCVAGAVKGMCIRHPSKRPNYISPYSCDDSSSLLGKTKTSNSIMKFINTALKLQTIIQVFGNGCIISFSWHANVIMKYVSKEVQYQSVLLNPMSFIPCYLLQNHA